MIDQRKFKDLLTRYKSDFAARWEEEQYKWQAVKWFRENWDPEAPDFGEMYLRATAQTGHLLAFSYRFPRQMIKAFAAVAPEETRALFARLYDEALDLAGRIDDFSRGAEDIRVKYNPGSWKNHYQHNSAASIYLWLRYPDKYYIYKYSICRDMARALGSDYKPVKGRSGDKVAEAFGLYDEIRALLVRDQDLMRLVSDLLDENRETCDPDKAGNTLTVDFCYYAAQTWAAGHARLDETDSSDLTEGDDAVTADDEEDEAPGARYWWLTANPGKWSFASIEPGQTQTFTLYNENGKKRRIFSNFLEARAGDQVVCYESTPVKKIVALGKISRASNGNDIEIQKLENLAHPVDYAAVKEADELKNMEFLVNGNGSLFKMTADESEFVLSLVRDQNPVNEPKPTKTYGKKEFLAEVILSESDYDTLASLVERKKNVLLRGAPGVGKTFIARKLAYALMGEIDDDRVESVQFHQSYAYEDFIMGYKPDGAGYKLEPGVFYSFCQKASNRPDLTFFFLIDEINRGNAGRIFGEALGRIEADYRGEKIKLACSGGYLSVPDNLRVIATMNTADRSIAEFDFAMERRFSKFTLTPAFGSAEFDAYRVRVGVPEFDRLVDRLIALNDEIAADPLLGPGFVIGHSHFCQPENCKPDCLEGIVRYDLLPLLQDYFRGDPTRYQSWEKKLTACLEP